MRHIFRLTILTALLIATISSNRVTAQLLDTSYYAYPLKDVVGHFSANFAEMRSNHFHSGIDFKTDRVEGKPVIAVAEGYVSRVFFSPSGYGRALYVTHPNGTTSVYGHLSSFREDIEKYLNSERVKRRANRVDLYCDSTLFRVERGEKIGESGNSGSSFGPHLHFEIRDTRSSRTLNTLAAGLFSPRDKIAPYILRLHYIEVDTMRGAVINSTPRSYDVERYGEGNRYRLRGRSEIEVGSRGYFVIETSDRKDEVSNTFGIYSLKGYIDQECFFDYTMDGFTFDITRYCNAVSYYPMQVNSRNEVIRLCRIDGNLKSLYRTIKDDGVISVEDGKTGRVKIVVSDDCGNSSELSFDIKRKPTERDFRAKSDTISPIVERDKPFRHTKENLTILIPRNSLYESVIYTQEFSKQPLKRDTSIVVLSPVYRILNPRIPLHKGVHVSIKCSVPKELIPHVMLGSRNNKGRVTALGGEYKSGAVEGKILTLGDIYVVADTIAPIITPKLPANASLKGRKSLRVNIRDNFSGVKHWAAYIDGKWTPFDYHPVKGYATLPLPAGLRSGEHTLTIVVTDPCNNTAKWEGEFSI